jgi:hypothetical protein
MHCALNSDASHVDRAGAFRPVRSAASAAFVLLALCGLSLTPAKAGGLTATSHAYNLAHAKPTKIAMGRAQFDRVDMQDVTGSIGSRPVAVHESSETAYVCSLSGAGQTTSCSLQRVGPRF